MTLQRFPRTYKQWAKRAGTKEEFGAKATVTDKLLREFTTSDAEEKLVALLTPLFSNSFAKALKIKGMRPSLILEVGRERDAFLRADEFYVTMEATQGSLPIEYLNMAYYAWQENYKELKARSKESLFECIKNWYYENTFKKSREKQRTFAEKFLEELVPNWEGLK